MLAKCAISIHAPVKGATDGIEAYVRARQISIHAPVKGATLPDEEYDDFSDISIHAPVKGATSSALLTGSIVVFQSTLP